MHGLVNCFLKKFITETYGQPGWNRTCGQCALVPDGFEAMLEYDDELTFQLLDAASHALSQPVASLLEDAGTFLVSHGDMDRFRRLLRFGGETFEEFLFSLNDLPDRVHLALPDFEMPQLSVRSYTPSNFSLSVRWKHKGFGHLMLGILRGMADDYGALVLLDHSGTHGGIEVISISIIESSFARGRNFSLGEAPEHRSAVA